MFCYKDGPELCIKSQTPYHFKIVTCWSPKDLIMMKAFVVYFVLVGAFQVRGAPLSLEQQQKLETYHKDCLKESNVNEVLVEKSRRGFISNDPAFKSYLYCFSQRVGFQDAKGTIQKDIFEKKVSGLVDDKEVVSRLLNECAAEQSSPENTAFHIAKCMREVSPNIEIFKATPEIIYLSNEKAQKMLIIHKECAAEDSLEEQVIENARKQGTLFEDPKFKSYIYCFAKKQGFQREDGSFNKESFSKCFQEIIDDKSIIEKLVEKCAQEQDTPENTAFFISKCVHENSPVYVELFPRELTVPEEEAKKIVKYGRACIKETGVDIELLEKTRQGIFAEDPKLKEFTFCMSKKAGVLNEAGDIQSDVLREKTLKLINDPVIVQKLIDQCAIKKDTPQDTAFYSHVCFHKNSPGHLSITQFGAISEAQKEKRRQVIKECADETGVPRNVVLSARKGDFHDDPILKQYFFCINKKSGILNEAGEYKEDVMRKSLVEIFNEEEAERLIAKCGKNQDNPLNTSFEGLKCVYNEIPEVSLIF